jgi:hypothetical protein
LKSSGAADLPRTPVGAAPDRALSLKLVTSVDKTRRADGWHPPGRAPHGAR